MAVSTTVQVTLPAMGESVNEGTVLEWLKAEGDQVEVGETLVEREAGITADVVTRQLDAVLAVSGVASLANAVIAYEPVWAIGTGRTATKEQAQETHALIRARIAKDSAGIASKVQILYGGSVKPGNAKELFGQPDIDGGLIGGAALVADDFLAIAAA